MAEAGSSDSEEEWTGRFVVIDSGSEALRAGFSGHDSPSVIIPSLIGRPKVPDSIAKPWPRCSHDKRERKMEEQIVFGEEVLKRRAELKVRYPVEFGIVTSWEDLERLWLHALYDHLSCETETTPMIVVEGEVRNPGINREKMTQMAFETFNVPAFFLAPAPSLILHATNRTSGIVVDIGENVIRAVAVYEGHCVQNNVMGVGSRNLTDYLGHILAQRELAVGKEAPAWLSTHAGRRELKAMKEQYAYVAQDFQQEVKTFSVDQEKRHQREDGEVITLGVERFQCAEPFFDPAHIGFEMCNLVYYVLSVVKRCDAEVRQELLSNVVLAGGASALPGLATRLQQELQKEILDPYSQLSRDLHVQVVAPPGGGLLAWKGGSQMASQSSFLDLCISKDEYDECGPSLVHKKCY